MWSFVSTAASLDDSAQNPRGVRLAHVSLALLAISFCFVAARWYTRFFITRVIGSDDWVISVAFVLTIPLTILYCLEAQSGFGLHIINVDQDHVIQATKYFFAGQLLYRTIITLTKVSLLLLYLRIFIARPFRILTWTVVVIVIGYWVSSVFTTVFQCTPISKFWDKNVSGFCINVKLNWYSTAAFSMISNLVIIALPLRELTRLRMPTRRKMVLSLMFGLGFFVIATTVIRIIILGPTQAAKDLTYFQALSHTWTDIEVNTGIICACLPTLRAPIVSLLPFLSSSRRSGHKNLFTSLHPRSRTRVLVQAQSALDTGLSEDRRRSVQAPKSGRMTLHQGSDDEIIINEVNGQGILKTTMVDVSWRTTDEIENNGQRDEEMGAGGCTL